jgi:hypothetical protein
MMGGTHLLLSQIKYDQIDEKKLLPRIGTFHLDCNPDIILHP